MQGMLRLLLVAFMFALPSTRHLVVLPRYCTSILSMLLPFSRIKVHLRTRRRCSVARAVDAR